MASIPSPSSQNSLPLLPSSPPPDGPPAEDASAVPREALDADALSVLNALWDPIDGQVDLRDCSPDALSKLMPSTLCICKEARFVAVPSHCPVTTIHTLLVGLPSLEALFTWDPGESQPIRLVLGLHLKLIMGDVATLSRTIGPNDVQRVACHDPRLPMEKLCVQARDVASRQRPSPPWTPCPEDGSPVWELRQRPLSTLLNAQVSATRNAATRNDAVGYRLATWQQTEPANSRPSSPGASVEAPVLRSGRPGRAGRVRSAVGSLLARLPASLLRR